MISRILKFEGFTTLLLALFVYQLMGFNWVWFLLLIFVPDISLVGYLKNKKIGALIYNFVHNLVTATILIFVGFLSGIELFTMIGIILIAHVGMDRALGYGLKYPTSFKQTHVQKV